MKESIKLSTILDLIKNKNQTGFDLLYEHHYRLLFSTAFSVTKEEQDSQDVVQNVTCKLATLSADQFPKTGEVSWLYRVVKNEALNYVKQRKTSVPLDDAIEIPVWDHNLDDWFDLESYHSLTKDLDQMQKEVVTLKILGGFTHKEIAKLLDKPIGTVQWIYNTSIKKLRRSLEAMLAVVVALTVGLGVRLNRLQQEIPSVPPGIGHDPPIFDDPTIESMPPVEELSFLQYLMDDRISLLFLCAMVGVFIAMLLFFQYSDRLPTKQKH